MNSGIFALCCLSNCFLDNSCPVDTAYGDGQRNCTNKKITLIRGQSIKKPKFFKMYCFTYNLIKLVTFKVFPSTLDTQLPTFFFFYIPGTRPGTFFTGRFEGNLLNFLLSPLPSEIGDLLLRISTSGTRKSPQVQIWRVVRLGDNSRLMLRQKFMDKE